jgi:hypothetical protein
MRVFVRVRGCALVCDVCTLLPTPPTARHAPWPSPLPTAPQPAPAPRPPAPSTLLPPEFHQHARSAAANQELISRSIDLAEAKAARALRHLRQQLTRARAANAALRDAAALPGLLAEVSGAAEALRGRCGALAAALGEAEAAKSAAAAAAAAGGGAGGGGA